MRVLGLIASPDDPASRARILQYKRSLHESGITLDPHFFSPLRNSDPAPWAQQLKKITGISEWRISNTFKTIARLPLLIRQFKYDLIWQNRLVLPHHAYFEKKYNRPMVFDFDDAIWLDEGEKEVIKAIKGARMVFAGNEYLAEFAGKYHTEVKIVPSTIDVKTLFPIPSDHPFFTIGWIGSKSNFKYLDLIRDPVLEFLNIHKDARFMVVSSEEPGQFRFDDDRILFRYWASFNENELINQFSVGLMPLTDSEYAKGKCGYKLLQYMACKVPFIASPAGVNIDLISTGAGMSASDTHEWLKGLIMFKNDLVFRQDCGEKGYRHVNNEYNSLTWSLTIAQYFRQIV